VGLEPHLILRTKRANEVEARKEEDPFGYVGNILFGRMAGATIHTCTPGEYGRVGSEGLIEALSEDLESLVEEKKKRKVYKIPVGGSNGLGTWGYIEAVDELMHQIDGDNDTIDHIVFACGSGGTAAGISLGLSLAYRENDNIDNLPKVHAVGVCDFPDYFYGTITSIAKEMGLDMSLVSSGSEAAGPCVTSIEDFVRDSMTVYQGKGTGYASSTSEELDFIVKFALETGISLDPVYSGKALFQFINEIKDNPESYRNSSVVFWHTGGSLGNYDKNWSGLLHSVSSVERMDVYSKK
jgi:D-cysteine desulfhydrase